MYLEEQPVVPYETLRYLIAQINYGGRVTDNKDERCISALLSNYVCEDVMGQGYKFSESGIYKVPEN
jgi:dynein heavy chain, axonemal